MSDKKIEDGYIVNAYGTVHSVPGARIAAELAKPNRRAATKAEIAKYKKMKKQEPGNTAGKPAATIEEKVAAASGGDGDGDGKKTGE